MMLPRVMALALLLAPQAHAGSGTDAASFLKLEPSARAAAIGGGFVALSNDSSAIFYNPAGLALLTRREILISHNEYIENINNETLAYVWPLNGPVNLSFGANMLLTGDMQKYDSDGVGIGNYSANEGFIVGGAGGSVTKAIKVGGAVKMIYQSIGSRSARTYAADGGVIYRGENIRIGVAAQNWGGKLKLYEQSSALPCSYTAGVAYPAYNSVWVAGQVRKYVDGGLVSSLGIEVGIGVAGYSSIYLRGGYRSGPADEGSGITAGFGIKDRSLEFNYAVTPLGEIGISHLFTFTYKLKGQKKVQSQRKAKKGYWMW